MSSLQEPFSFSVSIFIVYTFYVDSNKLSVGVWQLIVLTNNHFGGKCKYTFRAENWNQKTMFRLNASVVIRVKEKHLVVTSAQTLLSSTYAGANWNWIISIDAAFLVNIPLGQSYLTAQHVTSPLYFCTLWSGSNQSVCPTSNYTSCHRGRLWLTSKKEVTNMPVFVCSMSNYRSWSQRKFLIFKQTGCLQPLELVPRLVHLPPSLLSISPLASSSPSFTWCSYRCYETCYSCCCQPRPALVLVCTALLWEYQLPTLPCRRWRFRQCLLKG